MSAAAHNMLCEKNGRQRKKAQDVGLCVTISRSRDYSLLWRIATSPRIYRMTSDDRSPAPLRWRIQEREDCIYLLAKAGNQILGFCAFYPVNGATYETHVCFLEEAYGQKALAAFKTMLWWIWENTRAARIVGSVPDFNELAIAFAKRAGFEVYGVNHKSFLKDGRLRNQICMGISKP